jgi:hypothetical protein
MAQVVTFPVDYDSEVDMIAGAKDQAVEVLAALIDRVYKTGFNDGYQYAMMEGGDE